MVRSMYAGVAGLRTHQSKMDVIGNNVANVNTWSFKSYSTNMTDVMYSTSSVSTGGQAVEGGYGGMNPTQLGYGSKISSVTPDLTKGAPAPSSNTLDNMIDGLGYYITGTLKKGGMAISDYETQATSKKAGSVYKVDSTVADNPDNTAFEYSRVGTFSIDDNGYLVDNQRRYIYGFRCNKQVNVPANGDPQPATFRDGSKQNDNAKQTTYPDDSAAGYTHTDLKGRLEALCVPIDPDAPKINGKGQPYKISSYKLDGNGTLIGYQQGTGKEITIGRVALATFENPQGLQKTTGSYWSYSNNGNAGDCFIGKPTPTTGGTLVTGYLEMSNSDVAKEFSDMVTTQRGYQANSKIITVTDEMLETLIGMKR